MDLSKIAGLFSSQGQNLEEIIANFKQTQKIELSQLFTYLSKEEELVEVQFHGTVIGVDIEQTDEIGFDGQISLIQIKDARSVYIFDVIEIGLESELLRKKLQELFENEKLVKVFYAASADILWLQRDFGIKVQNLCDLKEIADKSDIKGGSSLINLWGSLCNHHVSKSYKNQMQTSNWSQRPLSQEQLVYSAYDCYYLPYLRYKLLSEISSKPEAELTKLCNTMIKLTQKEYKKPISTRAQFIATAKSELNKILQEAQELNQIPQIYLNIIAKQTAQQLIKFLASEIFLIRQQFALRHNDPPEALHENYEVVLLAIKIFEKLNLDKIIQNYQPFYLDLGQYSNQQYDATLAYLNDKYELEWEAFLKLFLKGLYQSYLYDEEFIKYSLNEVYDAENQSVKSKEATQQKLEGKKVKQIEFAEKYTRQKPAYGSCKIYTKDDLLLCNCDEKKIRWYLKQELADVISENPLSIRLRFDPSGFKQEGADKVEYITIERVNQCVICGSEQHLLKYHIVPVMYKKHIQGKRSYDVVCLCMTCHQKASAMNDQFKQQVAQKYNVPMQTHNKKDSISEQTKSLVKQIENFKKKQQQFPEEAKNKFKAQFSQTLTQLLQDPFFGQLFQNLQFNKDENGAFMIDDTFIENVLQFSGKIQDLEQHEAGKLQDHGKLVVDQLKSEKDIEEFLVFWRDQFLNNLKPQYLTEAWALDHRYKRTFGDKSAYKGQQQEPQLEKAQNHELEQAEIQQREVLHDEEVQKDMQ